MRDRSEKGLDCLAAQDSSGTIGHRARNDKRNALAQFLEELGDGRDSGFGVQGVENRLDHQQIDAAFH
jgi:hypothetical protein